MNNQTLEKMRKMKLYGMQRSFKHATETQSLGNLTPDELINMLVDSEWDDRGNRARERSITNAKFRYKTSIEGIDFNPERHLDRNQILRLADCSFIDKAENVLITGSTGTGKSYLACAVRRQVH
jgi:DNA replication protein DnaC